MDDITPYGPWFQCGICQYMKQFPHRFTDDPKNCPRCYPERERTMRVVRFEDGWNRLKRKEVREEVHN